MPENQSYRSDLRADIGLSNAGLAIFLISILGLFLEMMLIRWIATEVRIFAYLQNTILVVCFLGLGLGCFTSRQDINIRSTIIPLFAITAIMAIPISRRSLGNISELLSVIRDLPIFYRGIASSTFATSFSVALGLSLTFFLMIVILDMFVPLGRILGRFLDNHPKVIWAYSVNIIGSLIGTWLFVLLSSLRTTPVFWCFVAVSLLFFFLKKRGRKRVIDLALCFGLLILSWFAGVESGTIEVAWSPYQKLVLRETDPSRGEIGKFRVDVNNVKHQEMVDLNPFVEKAYKKGSKGVADSYSQYDIQLLLHPNPKKMLVLGSGTGNDVAGALRNGVEEITAVEIDPAIISMGGRYHPQNPYDSPLVRIVNDDARSFFASCKDRFDVISFGLLDSHTSPIMTNTRLDEYVFTRESLERAKSLLNEGGIMVLHTSASLLEFYIADRIAHSLRNLFKQDPLSFPVPRTRFGDGGIMFVSGDLSGVKSQLLSNPALKDLINGWRKRNSIIFPNTTSITTDDWPYLYLESHSIPLLYYFLAALMVLLFIRSCRNWGVSGIFVRWNHSHWHFFFLGAAFMLLEVQNISKAAVVFGSTWLVNAVIVSGVLFMVLLANVIKAKYKELPVLPVYAILCGICLLLYYVDLARLAFLPYLAKAIMVGGLTTVPMIFSGIIFIRSFSKVEKKNEALGANLMGALVGALLQAVTFITGIKALLLIVAGLYLLSLLIMPRYMGIQFKTLGKGNV